MNKLNLKKGDAAVLCVYVRKENEEGHYKPVNVHIKAVRASRGGHTTYWIEREDGRASTETYNELGCRNFKTWKDAAWAMHPAHLCADMTEAKRICK